MEETDIVPACVCSVTGWYRVVACPCGFFVYNDFYREQMEVDVRPMFLRPNVKLVKAG
jgi:hypothetical protein